MTPSTEKRPLLATARTRLAQARKSPVKPVLVIHGGAGTMSRDRATPEIQAKYHTGLRVALLAGHAVLEGGGESLDAVVAAVTALEDNPLFNAGKGAVFNVAGKNELETSLMTSRPPTSHPTISPTRRGTSATLLSHTRNPSKLARALYLNPEVCPHPMLSGHSAEKIAQSLGVVMVDPSYYFTEARWREHRQGLGLPDKPYPPGTDNGTTEDELLDLLPTGTVGAVALDSRGCITCLTSTGGRTNKLVGRIGDTPQMGMGFWAEEWDPKGWLRRAWEALCGRDVRRGVGISGTGDGDYFIRQGTAVTIARRMQHFHESVSKASEWAVNDLLQVGGIGGVIALDNRGNVATPLNCSGMYRGLIRSDGTPKTAIFDDETLE